METRVPTGVGVARAQVDTKWTPPPLHEQRNSRWVRAGGGAKSGGRGSARRVSGSRSTRSSPSCPGVSSPLPRAGALTLWDTMKPLTLCEPTLRCEMHGTTVQSGTTGPLSSSGTPPARLVWHEVPEVVAGTHSERAGFLSRLGLNDGNQKANCTRARLRVAVTRSRGANA